ncbi:MAG: peptidase M16 [Candidatus Aminicenantes bacterium]|nr:MAG: peptidase M16 [Candidatus Aminicenantes bacterium]
MRSLKKHLALWLGLNLSWLIGTGNWLAAQSFFPPLQRRVLKNGLPLIYQQDSSSPLTILILTIKGGRRGEPQGKAGLGYLTTRLSLEITDQNKLRQLMTQASQLTFSTLPDYNLIRLASLSPHFAETLKLIINLMRKPLFSGLRINRIKKSMLRSKKRLSDQASNLAREEAHAFLFGSTGYGTSSFGSEKTLKNISKKDIEKYYKSFFTAANMVAVVISDKDLGSLLPLLEEQLGKFPPGKPLELTPLTFPPLEEQEKKLTRKSQELLLYLAYRLPPLTPKITAFSLLLDNLLGKGVASRLWKLREYEKLAYDIQSEVHLYQAGGILEIYLETSPKKRDIAWQSLEREIDHLLKQPLSEAELAMTKAYTKASLLRQCQEKNSRATYLATFEATGLGAEFLEELLIYFDELNLGDFNAFIQKVLSPGNRFRLEIGPLPSSD